MPSIAGKSVTTVVSSLRCFLVLLFTGPLVLLFAGGVGAAVVDDVAPVPRGEIVDDDTQTYLMKYGYLSPVRDGVAALRTEESLHDAIRRMQEFAHIPVTGELDERTKRLMRAPRCGLPDYDVHVTTSGGRSKRYLLHHGRRWDHLDLTWTLIRSGVPSNIQWHEARQVIAKALDLWAKHSKLTFTEVDSDKADIVVSFVRGDHGDNFTFDGRGQVLAHAFFPGPGRGGDAHFDSDEFWVTSENEDPEGEGTSLFKVAAHEFGHSLGLSHSSVEGALMAPYYQAFSEKDYELPDDDKLGIQALYGSKEKQWAVMPRYSTRVPPPTTTTTTTTTTIRPRWSPVTRGVYHPRNNTPRKTHYYTPTQRTYYTTRYNSPTSTTTRTTTTPTTTTTTPAPTYPTKTHKPVVKYPWNSDKRNEYDRKYKGKEGKQGRHKSDRYPVKEYEKPDMCRTNFDAAALIRGEVFFFKDRYFWRIGERGLYTGYPFLITTMFMDLPSNLTHVDAVYERSDNKIVIFIGRYYYVFSMTNRIRLEPGFPRPLQDLGLPASLNKIDGASVWGYNGKTFFYSEHEYWRVDDDQSKVELDYPRLIKRTWRGLPNEIDAVFQWRDGKTYFFKGRHYFKFDDVHMRAEKPKPIGPYFLGCQNWINIPEKEPYTAPEHSSGTVSVKKSRVTFTVVLLVVTLNVFW